MTHSNRPVKFDRNYSSADLEFFAQYTNSRENHKPKQCTTGPECWVRCGPPSYRTKNNRGFCTECRGDVK